MVLQQYDQFINKKINPIEKFKELINNFKRVWNNYSNDTDKGFRIKMSHMICVIEELEWEYLSVKKSKDWEIKQYITEMDLIKDKDDYIYFYDVIFKLIRKELGVVNNKRINISLIVKEEERVKCFVKRIIKEYLDNLNKDKIRIRHDFNKFNPINNHLYYKVSFQFIKKFIGKIIL